MGRRCVVCGKYVHDNGCEPYHYPKNRKEALIWQRSMGANETCVNTIQKQCCVCIKHIPQFVKLTQKQGAFKTPQDDEQIMISRPSLGVLVLPGAPVPLHCESSEKTETNTDDHEDEEIIVKEFNVNDSGATFPDLDETEVTVLRTPMQNEEDLNKGDRQQCGDIGNTSDCTDVLLLSQCQNYSNPSCQCKLCAKQCPSSNKEDPLNPHRNNDLHQALDGDECEPKVSSQLGEVIKRQKNRISELENQLCRHTEWQLSMQQKFDQFCSEIGRLEPPVNYACTCLSDDQMSDSQR